MTEPVGELVWRRSSLCGNATCVEVASDSHAVYLRDGKDPDGPRLTFSHEAWRTWIDRIKNGDGAIAPGPS
jgi:hypothetical protein